MLQLVWLKGCLHVFDLENRCFIKTTNGNIARALGLKLENSTKESGSTRRRMIENSKWETCIDKGCKYCNPRSKDERWVHWVKSRSKSHLIALRNGNRNEIKQVTRSIFLYRSREKWKRKLKT